jgi:hypothetical protein
MDIAHLFTDLTKEYQFLPVNFVTYFNCMKLNTKDTYLDVSNTSKHTKTSYDATNILLYVLSSHECEYLETLFMLCFVSILISSANCEWSWIHLSQAKYHQIDIVAATHE